MTIEVPSRLSIDVPSDIADDVDLDLLGHFLLAIAAERLRAHEKHGATSMEQSQLLHHRRACILMEEAAECSRALNDVEHGALMLVAKRAPDAPATGDELDKELIQTAAMAYTWWANRRGDRLDPPAPEHLQNESYGAVELLRKVLTSTFPPMPLRREIEEFLNPVPEPEGENDELRMMRGFAPWAVFAFYDNKGHLLFWEKQMFTLAPSASVNVPELIPVKAEGGLTLATWKRVGEPVIDGNIVRITVEST